jgi:preprotein translocase subunit SecE
MAKKKKSVKKRADRRERAKFRSEGTTPEDDITAQEDAAEEAVKRTYRAVPEEPPARVRKAPKPPKEVEQENAWERLQSFIREVIIEAKKINWPSTDDTWKSTWVTVIVIIFLSAFMGAASMGFKQISTTLFGGDTNAGQAGPGDVPTTSQEAVEYDPDAAPTEDAGAEEPSEPSEE